MTEGPVDTRLEHLIITLLGHVSDPEGFTAVRLTAVDIQVCRHDPQEDHESSVYYFFIFYCHHALARVRVEGGNGENGDQRFRPPMSRSGSAVEKMVEE